MRTKRRILSLLLCGAMLFSLCSQVVFAEASAQTTSAAISTDGLCEHHPEHDDECGYTEGEAGTPCAHEHRDDCYTEVVECVHEHDEDCYPEMEDSISDNDATPSNAAKREPENCPHICDEDSGCITRELNCQHEHDDECGYFPATEETPCGFVCKICGAEDNTKTATPSNAEAVTVASVQAMIDALPDAEEIGKDNAEEVESLLEAIDKAKAELSDEELDELDFSHYMEAAAVLEQLLYGTATPSNAVMLADYDGPAIQLGTGGISDPTEVDVEGRGSYYAPSSYVYFGVNSENNSTSIKWRVLDADKANDGTTGGMFLLSEYLLASGVKFNNSQSDGHAYQGSKAQEWCSTFAGSTSNFSTTEQAVMLGAAKTDSTEYLYSLDWGASSLTANDKLFFLSVRELADYVGNYDNAPGLPATDTAQIAGAWWLRSPGAIFNFDVGVIHYAGELHFKEVDSTWVSARPAFNLNPNAVLFSSAAESGKTDALVDDNLTEVGTGSAEWKLTLKDTSRSFSASASNTLVRVGENLTVTYSGAGTGENEYVSAMIADNSNNILYYGRIAQNSADGTASVAIPSDLTEGTYTLKVFSEQYNGDYKTDYASEFQDITLTVKEKVREQFNLAPGTTYWFDLSDVGIPGTPNSGNSQSAASVPDTTFHWVPFTYTGTLNAYVLNSSSSGVKNAADAASGTADSSAQYGYTYDHSLFIADYAVTHSVSWKALNDKNMIFGSAYKSGGIDYTLRAPSAGSDHSGSAENERGIPNNNEWDTILNKAKQGYQNNTSGYIKNFQYESSWGQESCGTANIFRASRGYASARCWMSWKFMEADLHLTTFRPVLEVLNTDKLGSDGLKTIALDLNGGSIGDATGTINIVVNNGESFTAPASDGLTRPAGNTDAYFWWQGSDGNFYLPGTDVPAGVTSLAAQWTALTYTVTLNANGGAIASGKDVTGYTYGVGAILPAEDDITRAGYTFKGWYENSSFSGSPVTEISGTDTGNKTFYAKWEANTYTVTVQNDGKGTGAATPASAAAGTEITLSATPNSGYRFKTWEVISGGVTISNSKFTMPAGNVTVKAVFEKKPSGGSSSGGGTTYYTLTFETNGGSSIKTISMTYGNTIDLSGYAPARDGYDFSGWYSDKGLTNKITEIKLTGNKTVYAGWTKHNPNTGASNPFTDVFTSDWFYDDVMFVYQNGLMAGTSATTFAPYDNTTRAQIAVIFYRMEGSPNLEGKNDFTDVEYGPGTAWYYDAVTWAQQSGVMAGYGDGKFGPNDPVTREQLASIFYRYAQYKGYDTTQGGMAIREFSDYESISSYAVDAVAWAVNVGIMSGKENNLLDPQGTATRAEIAAMLHRFIEKYGLNIIL